MVRRKDCRCENARAVGRLVVTAVLLLALCGGCGAQKRSTRVVRMGILRKDIHQLAYYVAREKGFFTERGIEIKEVEAFNTGSEEMSAFSAGELDMGYVEIAPVTTFVGRGMAEVKIVAQADAEGSAIVVRNGYEAEDVSGLEGRNVAVPGFFTVQDFLLRIALKRAKISDRDVSISAVDPAQMPGALAASVTDAAVTWEPYPSAIEAQKGGRLLITSAKIWPHHPYCMLVGSEAFLRDNPELVGKVVAAHVEAMDYINRNPLEAADMAELFSGQPKEVAHAAMKNIEFSYVPVVKSISKFVEFQKDNGVIKVENPEDFAGSLVYSSFIPKAP